MLLMMIISARCVALIGMEMIKAGDGRRNEEIARHVRFLQVATEAFGNYGILLTIVIVI